MTNKESLNAIPYESFSRFSLRTPALPIGFLDRLLDAKTPSDATLKNICSNPIIQEAIYMASPSLFNELQAFLKRTNMKPKDYKRLIYSLARYVLRMATRPTPFGEFAGLSMGYWDDKSDIELEDIAKYRRHTRLDMDFLCALAHDLAEQPDVRAQLLYRPNSSLYRIGNDIRYVGYAYNNGERVHYIAGVKNSEYVERILLRSQNGATIRELADSLIDDEITLEEAREYVEELTRSQILVNELEPAITGNEPLEQILACLERIPEANEIASTLARAREDMRRIEESPIGTTVPQYQKIAKDLKSLGTPFDVKFLFQTDMIKPPLRCALDRSLINILLEALEILNKLSPWGQSPNLTRFKERFLERYETREIPLLQALDTESGIGYGQEEGGGDYSPLVDDIRLPSGTSSERDIRWDATQAFLHRKYEEALAGGIRQAQIEAKELAGLQADWNSLPDTVYAVAEIVQDDPHSPNGTKIHLSTFLGSSSANILGRFCHCDPNIYDFVKEIVQKEAELNPDVVIAEIVHLPSSRLGNVLLRPVLRKFEIPYMATSGVPPNEQIWPDDLSISLKNGRIILRSRRLDKEVLPRLTSAHNFRYKAMPVYQFLAEMQTQNKKWGCTFNWGGVLTERDFLPRVIYKNIIFSLARWGVTRDEIKDLIKIDDDSQLVEEVQKWRLRRKLPENVLLEDGDNRLFANLKNALCIRTLFSVVKNRSRFNLTESMLDLGASLVTSRDQRFAAEFVVAFYRKGGKIRGEDQA